MGFPVPGVRRTRSWAGSLRWSQTSPSRRLRRLPHGDFPVRQAQETPVQVYLRPCEIQNFSGLHLKLPAHPEGQSHHGAALLLNDPPKEVFAVRRQLRRGALALLKVLGKGAPEGGDRHAADPGGVGPVMSLKLADDEVLTEILETDLLALGVQRGPGQPGRRTPAAWAADIGRK